ncbi:hypothetical protein [Candidatus Cryosericum terrychapinii]|uniref:Uncharacterized protein n=1 Tax=Candidatus Cryosericum terrychapinii TaxID=2290919 RepID=A0A398CZU4_9BACT|nr:hypothetical protein [Candidatus Cryosericum terrychapinii]RIE06789.1 hypothetical protein SMC7_00645 [Candidatus Cryosericum terrychapinii]
MKERKFIVSFGSDVLRGKDALDVVDGVFEGLRYRRLANTAHQRMTFERGSKIATYMGLVNTDLIYRRVEVEMVRDEGRVILSYLFSWFTNVAVLLTASMPELKFLQQKFGARTLKVERFR